MSRAPDLNVVGVALLACSSGPITGYYRDGCCATGPEDFGSHTVCSIMSPEVIEFRALEVGPIEALIAHAFQPQVVE